MQDIHLGLANPSALHAGGQRASRLLDDARESLAAQWDAAPGSVVFTSGGTEADAIALTGLYAASQNLDPRRRVVLVGAGEHKAVLDTVRSGRALPGARVEEIPLSADGAVLPESVAHLLEEYGDAVALVSVMWANNEIGTVSDIPTIGALCRERGVALHTDAVQMPATRSFSARHADAIAVSAHKVGGPVGIGALILGSGISLPVFSQGGRQEGGIRSGTADVMGAVGFAAAVQDADSLRDTEGETIAELSARLIQGIGHNVPDAKINSGGTDRLSSHVHVTFPDCEADALLMGLDAVGVQVSTGSACSAGVSQASHVVLAMGAGEEAAKGSLRFSLGWATTVADVDRAIEAIGPAVTSARAARTAALVLAHKRKGIGSRRTRSATAATATRVPGAVKEGEVSR